MSYSTCEDDIKRILTELPSENHCIDYKLEPYETRTFPEFIRDVIAFLNCEESLFDDRYIILGVEETSNQRKLIGLNIINRIMPDDAIFQSLIRKIRPLPIVHCGTVDFQGMTFGYIHILKENTDRTYEVAEEYPQTRRQIDSISYKPANSVHAGQAYIRRGTAKNIMDQHERRRLESQVFYKQFYDSSVNPIPSVNLRKSSLTMNLVAALVGVWDSNYDGDKEIIERLSNLAYNDWECEFQKRIAEGSEQITYNQGQWTLLNHIETIFSNARAYFDSHLAEFFSCFSVVVNSYDKKFDLPNNSRLISISNEPTGKYSNGLREALILSFVNIATKDSQFTSCTKHFIINQVYKIIKKLISEGTWQVFAALNWQIVNISQAYPPAFLESLQTELAKPNNAFERLIEEKEQSIVTTRYYYGLISALQTLSWSASYFSTATEIIFRLSRFEKEIGKDFSAIFLPWYPQTEAPVTTRIGVIKHLVDEYGVECWDVIFNLMPRQTSIGKEIDPPEFIQGSFIREKVSFDEFWSTSKQYLNELLKITSANKDYCGKLVDLLDDVNHEMLDTILSFFYDMSESLDSDDERYAVWDKLLSLTERHRYFSESDWALPKNLLEKIDGLVDVIIPRDIDFVESRLFKKEQYDLLKSNRDRREAESELQAQQADSIKRIYSTRQILGVFQFAEMVESPHIIGIVLAGLTLTRIDEECILDQLIGDNEKLLILAKSYCNAKHGLNPENWLSSLKILSMPEKKRLMILSSIYICKAVLDIILKLPSAEQSEYWMLAPQWADESGITAQTVKGLVSANKLEQALETLVRIIDNGQLDSSYLAYYVLEANKNDTSYRSQMWSYYISQVFEWLQKDMSPDNIQKLTLFEWYYHPIFSHEGQAKALEYTLSSSPEDFITVLQLLYKGDAELDSVEKSREDIVDVDDEGIVDRNPSRKNLAHNAWNVLYNWRWTPGKLLDGSFDPIAFSAWVDSVKTLSAQKGLYDVAMQNIGHVLYYGPASQDGFFIHKAIAASLDKEENEHIRRGYRTEAFNARGVYNYDPSGQQEDELARLWIERAQNAEGLGYTKFGKTLRDIAQDFLNQKEHY